MLGETFEDTRMKFVAEKVSHRPPVVACHAQGDGWEFWGTSGAKNKFWGAFFSALAELAFAHRNWTLTEQVNRLKSFRLGRHMLKLGRTIMNGAFCSLPA